MCLSPIQIINPSKYISVKYRDRFLLSVPCGHCAECQRQLSNQWFFRSWQECLDIKNSGGYIYFDTLTYRDDDIPLMSDYIDILPKVPCFNSNHTRKFVDALQKKIKRSYGVNTRYFYSSEYGTDPFRTHRPHYHFLFFVADNGDKLAPIDFSRLVAYYWKYGRTDGVPWKDTNYVLSHNVILGNSRPELFLRACRYVTKYVQKSSSFDKVIDKRLKFVSLLLCDKFGEDWYNSVNAQRVMSKIRRNVSQFHRQSNGFGASFLQDIDLNQLFNDGCLYMPSPKGLKIPINIPMYYRRKLFYDLIEVDGNKVWCLNEIGNEYNLKRREYLISYMADFFNDVSLNYNLGYSKELCLELSQYVFDVQGRIKADKPSLNLLERLPSVQFFNYITLSDKEHLGRRGIINRFIGNNTIGYTEDSLPASYTFGNFIGKFVYLDDGKEKMLSNIYYHLGKRNEKKQSAFALTQDLEQKYKSILNK